jgi:translation initiation factor 3 subunit I
LDIGCEWFENECDSYKTNFSLESSTLLLTGAADNSAKLWDVSTGKEVSSIVTNTAVRSVGFAEEGNNVLVVTDATMGHAPKLSIYSLKELTSNNNNAYPLVYFDQLFASMH